MKKFLQKISFFLLMIFSFSIFASENDLSNNYQVQIKEAPLSSVVELFASVMKEDLVLPQDLTVKVSANFDQTNLERALNAILDDHGLMIKKEEGLLKVVKKTLLVPETYLLSTKTISLKYADGNDVKEQVKQLLSNQGRVVFDQRTSSITIKDKPHYLRMVENYIGKIDQPEKQIQIEAKFVEVSHEYLEAKKITWQKSLGLDHEKSFALGEVSDLSLELAYQNRWANLLSNPIVITQNRTTSVIKSGLEFYFDEDFKEIRSLDLGIKLKLKPQITKHNQILLDMEIRESTPVFKKKISDNPYTMTNYAKTQIEIKDGDSAIIGGFFQLDPKSSGKKLEALGRIPLAGDYFKNKHKSEKELLIIITPKII
jgi:type II secretory pathway component HofQ